MSKKMAVLHGTLATARTAGLIGTLTGVGTLHVLAGFLKVRVSSGQWKLLAEDQMRGIQRSIEKCKTEWHTPEISSLFTNTNPLLTQEGQLAQNNSISAQEEFQSFIYAISPWTLRQEPESNIQKITIDIIDDTDCLITLLAQGKKYVTLRAKSRDDIISTAKVPLTNAIDRFPGLKLCKQIEL